MCLLQLINSNFFPQPKSSVNSTLDCGPVHLYHDAHRFVEEPGLALCVCGSFTVENKGGGGFVTLLESGLWQRDWELRDVNRQ